VRKDQQQKGIDFLKRMGAEQNHQIPDKSSKRTAEGRGTYSRRGTGVQKKIAKKGAPEVGKALELIESIGVG